MSQQISVDKEILKEILNEISELKKLANHKTYNDPATVEKKETEVETVCFEEIIKK